MADKTIEIADEVQGTIAQIVDDVCVPIERCLAAKTNKRKQQKNIQNP